MASAQPVQRSSAPHTSAAGSLKGVRIAQIIECDGPGGAERVVAHLCKALVGRGAEVVAFLPRGREGWLGQQLRDSDVPIEGFDRRRAFSPGFAAWLTRSLRAHRVDLAHSHEFTFAVHGAWSARRLGIGHVTTIHGGRYWAGALRRRLLFRGALALGGELAAVSETLRGHLAEDLHIPEARIRYIPNGVPSDVAGRRAPLRRELGLDDADRLALAVGNLYPVKGHRVLVDALGALRHRQPSLHIAVAGRGAEESALLERADALGVRDRVHLLGLRSDVADLLAAADLFVMPSISEGLPMALLEAIFARVPIVASEVGAIPDVLEHGAGGLLVPPGDSARLAQAIDEVLANTETATGRAARARENAMSRYSLDAMVDRYVEVYSPLIRRS